MTTKPWLGTKWINKESNVPRSLVLSVRKFFEAACASGLKVPDEVLSTLCGGIEAEWWFGNWKCCARFAADHSTVIIEAWNTVDNFDIHGGFESDMPGAGAYLAVWVDGIAEFGKRLG